MKTIRCQNRFKDKANGRCGHILAILTDQQIENLKTDPEKPVLRCPACRDMRWIELDNDGDGLILRAIEKPDVFPAEPEYAEIEVFQQIG
jgi:hypothetical protein